MPRRVRPLYRTLHDVAACGDPITLRRYLEHTPWHLPDLGGRTAIHVAASAGNVAAVLLLIEMGADPDAKTPDGWRPIDEAISAGARRVVEMLSAYGATPCDEARDDRQRDHPAIPWP